MQLKDVENGIFKNTLYLIYFFFGVQLNCSFVSEMLDNKLKKILTLAFSSASSLCNSCILLIFFLCHRRSLVSLRSISWHSFNWPSRRTQEEHTDCILLIFSVILIISILLLLSLHLCLVSAQLLQGRKMLDQTAAAAQSRVWTDKTTMIYKAMIKPWRFSLQINNGIETRLEI